MRLRIAKVRDVRTPERGTAGSAGLDFFVPRDFSGQILSPHKTILIPAGIKVDVPDGFALIAFNKSGISNRLGLDVMGCVVDSDYQGEIHLSVVNTSDSAVVINAGDKLVQFILIPVGMHEVESVEEDELFEFDTVRGTGGFGSTGK